MTKITKSFASKQAAKKALHAVFGAGIYNSDNTYAEAKFLTGVINSDNTIELTSSYWTETSMQIAFNNGVDNI